MVLGICDVVELYLSAYIMTMNMITYLLYAYTVRVLIPANIYIYTIFISRKKGIYSSLYIPLVPHYRS